MKFALVALSALCSLSAFAETVQLPQKDDMLVASLMAIPLHESTPDASFGTKAPQIGWIQKGQTVKVHETRQYFSALGGTEIWVEVSKENEPNVKGWVMTGLSGGVSKLSPVRVEAVAPERAIAREAEISKTPVVDENED